MGIFLRNCLIYLLCIYYSIKISFGIILLFLTQSHKKFWKIKERPLPPKCLQNKELGEHKFIKANGIKFHYVESGDPNKPLMLFVHGFPEFWYSWRHQIREFSKDYWTIAFDMRGYGDTDKPKGVENYTIDILADDINAIVKALGREKFTLVGHDYGAIIAWKYLDKYMSTVDKYILMDAPPEYIWLNLMMNNWEQFRKSWYTFYFQAPYLPEFTCSTYDLIVFKIIGGGQYNKTFTEEDDEAFKYTFSKPGAFTEPLNYYRNIFKLEKSKPKLQDSYAPGLFMIGEHDKYVSEICAKPTLKLYKNLTYKQVKDANHFVQQDKPDEVNQMMRDFLNGNLE